MLTVSPFIPPPNLHPSPAGESEESSQSENQGSPRSFMEMINIVATTSGIIITTLGTLSYVLTGRTSRAITCTFLTSLLIHKLWSAHRYAQQKIIKENIHALAQVDGAIDGQVHTIEIINDQLHQAGEALHQLEIQDASAMKTETEAQKKLEEQLSHTQAKLVEATQALEKAETKLKTSTEALEKQIQKEKKQQVANQEQINTLHQEISTLKTEIERFTKESAKLSAETKSFNQSIPALQKETDHLKKAISGIKPPQNSPQSGEKTNLGQMIDATAHKEEELSKLITQIEKSLGSKKP